MQIYRSYHNHKVKTEKAEVDAKKSPVLPGFSNSSKRDLFKSFNLFTGRVIDLESTNFAKLLFDISDDTHSNDSINL